MKHDKLDELLRLKSTGEITPEEKVELEPSSQLRWWWRTPHSCRLAHSLLSDAPRVVKWSNN